MKKPVHCPAFPPDKKFTITLTVAIFFVALALSALSCSTKNNNESLREGAALPPGADTLSLEAACRIISIHAPLPFGASDSGSVNAFYHCLDSAAVAIRLSPSFGQGAAATSRAILDVVYKSWNIGFDSGDISPESLLPDRVFRERKGGCLGVSLIILMLAEKLGCPIYGVMLPGHFFCRYDDGRERVNIEPNRSGVEHDDAYYRSRYPIEKMPWYDLKNLSRPQVIGMLCYNCGTICLRHRLLKPAIAYLKECVRLINGYAEAKGNLAVAYAQSGSRDTAMSLFARLSAEYPDMVNLAANYGAVAVAANQYHKAMEIYLAGLERNPADQLLYRRATTTLRRLGKDDSLPAFKQRLQAITAQAEQR